MLRGAGNRTFGTLSLYLPHQLEKQDGRLSSTIYDVDVRWYSMAVAKPSKELKSVAVQST
jgi:hypothetical protein